MPYGYFNTYHIHTKYHKKSLEKGSGMEYCQYCNKSYKTYYMVFHKNNKNTYKKHE